MVRLARILGALLIGIGAPSVTASASSDAVSRLPRAEVLELAENAFQCARSRGDIARDVLAVIDYSLSSTDPRLWVLDMRTREVLHRDLVAHGRNSGEHFATAFSNIVGSKQSSLGLFRADEVYQGQHGYSLRLTGLEAGFNDRARERAIVMHGAKYVSREFVERNGRLGRSWGCPSVREQISRDVIDAIKDGGALFVYYPSDRWLRESEYLDRACFAAR